MSRLAIENLALFGAETAVLIAIGAAVGWLFRRCHARVQLLHWQMLLAACLLLPFVGRWNTPLVVTNSASVSVVQGATVAVPTKGTFAMSWEQLAAGLLLCGTILMLLRLAVGAWRVSGYRRRGTPWRFPLCDVEVLVSSEVSGPASYGILRPVILLPADFETWPLESQRCVLVHEMAHVERRDWLFGIFEELVRAVFWFHPGIWLVINRIHLFREQVVDAATLGETGNREAYIEALLSVAGLKERLGFVPAPLFVRKRHLAMRVAHLIKEVRPMNRIRMIVSLAAGGVTMAGAGAVLTTLFPYQAPAQEVRMESSARGAQILHQVPPRYPAGAKLKRIEGRVSAEVNIDAKGMVTDARVLSGPDDLRSAALQAVLQWQFTATGTPTRATVDVNFSLSKEGPPIVGTLQAIDLSQLPEPLRLKVAGRIPLKEGDAIPADAVRDLQAAMTDLGEAVRLSLGEDMVLRAVAAPQTLRVGGNVAASKITKKVNPVYPPLAKQARIQGTVRFTVRIDKDGKVANAQVIEGHPLLVPSALESVKQWEYAPTLLNGNPVEVLTQVDVNYTLLE